MKKRHLLVVGCVLLALAAGASQATTLTLLTPGALRHLSAQADRGDTDAMVEIGEAYHFGLTTFHSHKPAEDRATAIVWYERAAARGSARAARDLGSLYEDDIRWPGIPADLPRAFAWFSRAAQAGDVLAEGWLASLYERKGPPPAYRDAYRWRLKAARQGDTQSIQILDELYTAGCEVPSFDRAYARIEAGAKAGDSDAQWRLGLIDQDESLGSPDKDAGLAWLKKSADAGNAKGLFYLAVVTYTGGEHPDVDATVEPLVAQAADKGFFPAQDWWVRLHTPDDAHRDQTERRIFEWYRAASEQGYEIAQASLAVYFDKGQFVPVDRAEAYKWSLLSRRSPIHDGNYVEVVHDATAAEKADGKARPMPGWPPIRSPIPSRKHRRRVARRDGPTKPVGADAPKAHLLLLQPRRLTRSIRRDHKARMFTKHAQLQTSAAPVRMTCVKTVELRQDRNPGPGCVRNP